MLRKLLLALAILVVLGFGALYMIPRLRSVGIVGADALGSLPLDAPLVLRANRLGELSASLSGDTVAWEMVIAPQHRDLLARATGRLAEVPEVEVYVSLEVPASGVGHWLMAVGGMPLPDEGLDAARWVADTLGAVGESYDYDGIPVYEVEGVSPDSGLLYCATHYGVMLVSSGRVQLEGGLAMLNSGRTLMQDALFEQLHRRASPAPMATLFVRPQGVIGSLGLGLQDNLRGALGRLGRWSPWVSFDVGVEGGVMQSAGLSLLADSVEQSSATLAELTPGRVEVGEVLPDDSPIFMSWVGERGEPIRLAAQGGQRGPATTAEADRELLEQLCFGELALAYVPRGNSWVTLLRCESVSFALEQLDERLGGKLSTGRKKPKGVAVHKAERADILGNVLGGLFGDSSARYYGPCGTSWVAFSSRAEGVEALQVATKRPLASSESYTERSRSMLSESNFTLYLAQESRRRPLGSVVGRARSPKVDWLGRLRLLGVQVSGGSRDGVFYQVALQGMEPLKAGSALRWEASLGSALRSVTPVRSHLGRSLELFVERDSGDVSLWSAGGEKLWERRLPSGVKGELRQVDIYANGKLQYALCTDSSLWVIDRNGKDVEGFPAKLGGHVAMSMGIFRYDGNGPYRFVVGLTDGRVVAIGSKGEKVEGFEPPDLESPLVQKPWHMVRGGKDYIFLQTAHRLYVLNRRGEVRVKTGEPITPARGESLFARGGSTGGVWVVDSLGGLCQVELPGGKVSRTPLKGWKAGSHALMRWGGDTLTIYGWSGKELALFGSDGGERGRWEASDTIREVRVVTLNPEREALAVRVAGERLWLLDVDANPIVENPLRVESAVGLAPLDGGVGDPWLVTREGGSRLVCYPVALIERSKSTN